MTHSLKNTTLLITGATRGIGREIALAAAKEGANIIVAAKTVVKHPKLEHTIHSTVADIQALGAKALACKMDVRNEDEVEETIHRAAKEFGGIDILINNASAIMLKSVEDLEVKRFDLMNQVNYRGSFLCSKFSIPYLEKSENPHILFLSPPLNLKKNWFKFHTPYTISKYNMSMLAMGLAEELKDKNIAVNALWPKTTIGTAAIKNILGGEALIQRSRKASIVADAALSIFKKNSKEYSGQFLIDEEVLQAEGMKDFGQYTINPQNDLMSDLFLDD